MTELPKNSYARKCALKGLAAAILLGVIATPASADTPTASASIVNGTPASISQFPWLAHITYAGAAEASECTGTVVAPRLILTAGHCVVSQAGHLLTSENFRVTTGTSDLRQAGSGNVSQVVQTLAAPGFSLERLWPDAALLVLASPVSTPGIALAGPGDEALYNAGTPIFIAGWGLTDGRAKKTPAVLQQAETVIQSSAYCRQKTKRNPSGYDSDAQLCAIGAPKFEVNSCHGDSGGPGIAVRPDGTAVQVGVISFGLIGDCDPRRPEVHARVDRVSQWIGQWINAIEHGAPAPEVFIPGLLRLPPLTVPTAKYLDWEFLALAFRRRFLQGEYKDIACRRIAREKVKCHVFWYHARRVYSGAITTYLALPREGSLVNFRYRIRRFGAICWVFSRNPRSCPGVLFYG